jgi:hypothetical protein
LAQGASTPEFAALHRVGEEYAGRTGPGLPRPESAGSAQTLRQLAELYHRPLADFLLLNREAGWEADQELPPDTFVNVPDPGFATLLAALFSAKVLTAPALMSDERLGVLRMLVPVSAPNPTALDTVLARLLLAARPSDPNVLNLLGKFADTTLDRGNSSATGQKPAGIPS